MEKLNWVGLERIVGVQICTRDLIQFLMLRKWHEERHIEKCARRVRNWKVGILFGPKGTEG